MTALVVDGLHKRFGKTRALDGLSFSVPTGTICGLVGPNGAGKTTTLSILAGFLRPDAGRVDLLRRGPFDVTAHRGRVGILPQDADLPVASTPRQLLCIWGELQGLSAGDARRAADRVLETVLLSDRAEARVGTLSHGMRRRLTVASALLGDPELVLLDEPSSGLDPAQAHHLREALAAERGRRTLLVSSHNLAEVESLCDHVVVIDRGRCTRAGPMLSVTRADRQVTITLAAPYPPGRGAVVALRLDPDDSRPVEVATTELLTVLLAEGARIVEVRRGESLEARYLADTTSPE